MSEGIAERPQIVLVHRCAILSGGRLFLIQRSNDDHHNPGLWEFPGGKLDKGQTLNDALEREIFEESGLLIQPRHRIAYAQSEIITKGKYAALPYVVLVGIADLIGGNLRLSEEHQDFRWVTPKGALRFTLTQESAAALAYFKKYNLIPQ